MDDSEPAVPSGDTGRSADQGRITITADLAPTFTFASHQNSIPVVRSIGIENPTANSVENARLELTASPAFLRPKTWTIDRVLSADSLAISDRRIELDAAYLAGLDEAERGDIKLRLLRQDQ